MPNTTASVPVSHSLRSAAISVVFVVVANLAVFTVAALILIETASAESTSAPSTMAAAPPELLALPASTAPLPAIAPIQRLVATPVRTAAAIARRKVCPPEAEQKPGRVRVAKNRNAGSRSAL